MSQEDSGNKTEQATPKRLRDARKQGDVARSRDLTNAALLLVGGLVLWQLTAFAARRLGRFLEHTLSTDSADFASQLPLLASEAALLLVLLSGMVLVPVLMVGVLVEFLQIGPILTLEKLKPKLSNLDPVAGIKRMFSLDSLFELVKMLLKTAIIVLIAGLILMLLLPQLLELPAGSPEHVAHAMQTLMIRVLVTVLVIFAFLAALDMAYQQYSFAKKMKMSIKDIKQERKDDEGDPLVKNQRRQLGKEWAQEGATQAAKNATVLVVNPTHVAIAIEYDKEDSPIPTVSARGVEEMAAAMRAAAEEAAVPILRNERLARTLLSDTQEGDPVPRGLFDVVAEVIIWAQAVSKQLSEQESPLLATDTQPLTEVTDQPNKPAAPGEDLTFYPAIP